MSRALLPRRTESRKAFRKLFLGVMHSGIPAGFGTSYTLSIMLEEVFKGSKLTASVIFTNWFAEVKPEVVCPGLSSICRFFKFHTFIFLKVKVPYILLSNSQASLNLFSMYASWGSGTVGGFNTVFLTSCTVR